MTPFIVTSSILNFLEAKGLLITELTASARPSFSIAFVTSSSLIPTASAISLAVNPLSLFLQRNSVIIVPRFLCASNSAASIGGLILGDWQDKRRTLIKKL